MQARPWLELMKFLMKKNRDNHGEKRPGKRRVAGNPHQAGRAAHIGDVQDRDPDDFAQTQGRDRQIIALQAQGRQADGKTQDRGAERAGEDGDEKRASPA